MPSRPRIAIASMSMSLAMLFGPALAAQAAAPADALPTVKRTGIAAAHDVASVKRTGDVASVKRTGDVASVKRTGQAVAVKRTSDVATVKRTGDVAAVKRTGVTSADVSQPLDLQTLGELGLLG